MNRRRGDLQSPALPTELPEHIKTFDLVKMDSQVLSVPYLMRFVEVISLNPYRISFYNNLCLEKGCLETKFRYFDKLLLLLFTEPPQVYCLKGGYLFSIKKFAVFRNWTGWIRTNECRNQNPVAYHLPTVQCTGPIGFEPIPPRFGVVSATNYTKDRI